jgi:hypothetical protein
MAIGSISITRNGQTVTMCEGVEIRQENGVEIRREMRDGKWVETRRKLNRGESPGASFFSPSP